MTDPFYIKASGNNIGSNQYIKLAFFQTLDNTLAGFLGNIPIQSFTGKTPGG